LCLVVSSVEAAKDDAKYNIEKGVDKAKNTGKDIVDDTAEVFDKSK